MVLLQTYALNRRAENVIHSESKSAMKSTGEPVDNNNRRPITAHLSSDIIN